MRVPKRALLRMGIDDTRDSERLHHANQREHDLVMKGTGCLIDQPVPLAPCWYALISKGKRFDRHFKVHSWLAVFHRVLVKGERTLHEKHCPFGHRLLYGFSQLTPGPASELDREVFPAAFRGDSKRKCRKRRADWCYHQVRIAFYSAYCLQLNKHGSSPLAHMAAS